jgi:MinD superfamily P-loop ATPase
VAKHFLAEANAQTIIDLLHSPWHEERLTAVHLLNLKYQQSKKKNEENEWIDNAPQRDGAAREILRRADIALAVGTPDTLGIARLIRGLDDLREIRDDPLVVLNQTTRSTATEARSAMERFTSHTVSASVQRDGRRGIEDALARANTFAPVWSAVKTTRVSASVP